MGYTWRPGDFSDPDNPIPGSYQNAQGQSIANPFGPSVTAPGTRNAGAPGVGFVPPNTVPSGSTLAVITNVDNTPPPRVGAVGITGPPGTSVTTPRVTPVRGFDPEDPQNPSRINPADLTPQGGVHAPVGNPGNPGSSGVAPVVVPLSKWSPEGGLIDTRTLVPLAPSGSLFVPGELNLNGGTFINTGFVNAGTINLNGVDLINTQRLAEINTTTVQGPKQWTDVTGFAAQPGGFLSAAHWNINTTGPNGPGSITFGGDAVFDIPDASKEELAALLNGLQSVYGKNFNAEQLIEYVRNHQHDDRSWLQRHLGVVLAILAVIVAVACWGTCLVALSAFFAEIGLGTVVVVDGIGTILVANGLTYALAGATMAALTTLMTQLATAAITGDWNLERILKAVLLSAVTAGITAGALEVLDQILQQGGFLAPGQSLASYGLGADGKSINNVGQFVAGAGVRAVVQAGVTTLINGSHVTGTAFENAFLTSFVGNLSPGIANAIGSQFSGQPSTVNPDGSIDWGAVGTKLVVHAAAGCALAAARREDCGTGAIGASIGEFTAELLGNVFGVTDKQAILAASRLAAIGAAAAAGLGDKAATADFFADNAVQNNYLSHVQWSQLSKDLAACTTESDVGACTSRVNTYWTKVSVEQDRLLTYCDRLELCATLRTEVRNGTEERDRLIRAGLLPVGYAGGNNLQQTGERLANSSTEYRARVAASLDAALGCQLDPSACNRQAAALALGIFGSIAGASIVGVIASKLPALSAAAGVAIEACSANLALCVNRAGIAAIEMLGPEATGGALSLGGAAFAAASAEKMFVQLTEKAAVVATEKGFINATKICEAACSASPASLSATERAIVAQIQKEGDLGGALTERLFASIGQREGYTVLPGGKYGANNGFDLVLQGKDGSVTILMDAKQISNGAIKLDPAAAGKTTQLSEAWIDTVLSRLPLDSPARIAVLSAKDSGTLITAVGGVNKTTGVPVVVPVVVPPKLTPPRGP